MNEMCIVGGGDIEDGGPDLSGMSYAALTWADVMHWFHAITTGDDVIYDANGNPVAVVTHNSTDSVTVGKGPIGGQISINIGSTATVTPIAAPAPAPAPPASHGG